MTVSESNDLKVTDNVHSRFGLHVQLIPKTIHREIEKEIVREVARGDKPYLRKSTDRKAQISPLN